MKIGPFSILLVEDNPADIRLTREALKKSNSQSVLNVARDGVEAMDFLTRSVTETGVHLPDLIFLDLNLPRKNGREVLAELKKDAKLRRIPVAVFTTSRAEKDIVDCYDLHASCYLVKPSDLDEYFGVIRSTETYWLEVVTRAEARSDN